LFSYQTRDELEEEVEELDENNPYFGLSKAEIEELKRLEEEEKALERLERGEIHPEESGEFEKAQPKDTLKVKKSKVPQHDAELARLDELELSKIEAEEKAEKLPSGKTG